MTLLSRALTALGAILLAHACYSAQEHSSLSKVPPIDTPPSSSQAGSTPQPSPAPTPAEVSLPADIIIETLISVLIICVGLVLGSPALRPISWRVWAGGLERKGALRGGDGVVAGDPSAQGLRVNPFAALESRVGFWDIRAMRREFDDWARQGNVAAKS